MTIANDVRLPRWLRPQTTRIFQHRNYSSGAIGLSCASSRASVQSSINSAWCNVAHSVTSARARGERLPRKSESVSIARRALCPPFLTLPDRTTEQPLPALKGARILPPQEPVALSSQIHLEVEAGCGVGRRPTPGSLNQQPCFSSCAASRGRAAAAGAAGEPVRGRPATGGSPSPRHQRPRL